MPENANIAHIESLDKEGRGIAHVNGKAIFIYSALPYETVSYRGFRKKQAANNAEVLEIIRQSHMRVEPLCPHFAMCGGCSMQHIELSAQVAMKQRVLEDNLLNIGKVKPQMMLAPVAGLAWHYRHRARMSARFVSKKNAVLVGFHEKRSSFVADMNCCMILPKHISNLIIPLKNLVTKLSIKCAMPQIEVAVGNKISVLVFRNMQPITDEDELFFQRFVEQNTSADYPIQIWLQPKGPSTCYPLYPKEAPLLSYAIAEYAIDMPYNPSEFTQVNPQINQVMIKKALQLLAPKAGERIADMFCGIGNFTLPIARSGAQVVGFEGSDVLVKRAIENAVHNNLDKMVEYHVANLFKLTEETFSDLGCFDKILIDPPRDGAIDLVNSLNNKNSPQRIVYVSCNPDTLSRDADILVHEKNYTLKSAGIINMFPHTMHIESIACFERNK